MDFLDSDIQIGGPFYVMGLSVSGLEILKGIDDYSKFQIIFIRFKTKTVWPSSFFKMSVSEDIPLKKDNHISPP